MVFIIICVWCLITFIALVFARVENVGIVRFKLWAYKLGSVSRVFKNVTNAPSVLMRPANDETQNLKYSILANHICLFRRKKRTPSFKWTGFLSERWNTPFEMCGLIYLRDSQLVIAKSNRVGMALFVLLTMLGLILLGFYKLANGDFQILVLLGIAFAIQAIMLLRTYPKEQQRFREISTEMLAHLDINNFDA